MLQYCIFLSRATPQGRSRYQTSEFPTELPTRNQVARAARGGAAAVVVLSELLVIIGDCVRGRDIGRDSRERGRS